MIKKSKSMVMSAKDISMDAFHVMKGKADEKDKGWLQNFLTESLVEDVPWECSKALVILKQGYQAIIPREASRGILMGETSYTIIDDNGVEFFLSPKDKKARKDAGQDIPSDNKVKRSEDTLLDYEYKPKVSRYYHILEMLKFPSPKLYIYDVAIISPRSDRRLSCSVNDLSHTERHFSKQEELTHDFRQELSFVDSKKCLN